MLWIYLTLSPDFPTVVSGLPTLPLSPDLPTIITGFTYPRLRIYLPSSPDLPTIITGFTYLPSSPDLPTLVSGFTYHRLGFTYHCVWISFQNFFKNPTWWSLSFFFKKNSYGDHFLILPWWSFSDVDHFLYSPFKMCFLQVRLYTHVFSQSNSHCFSKLYISTVQC